MGDRASHRVTDTSPERPAEVRDSYAPFERPIGPPTALMWVRESTPRGAAALQVMVPPSCMGGPYPLPLTAPLRVDEPDWLVMALAGDREAARTALVREDRDWMLAALESAGVDVERRGSLARVLASNVRRADGLPAWWPPGNRIDGRALSWPTERQKLGSVGRGVWAAVLADFAAQPLVSVSSALGLKDHLQEMPDGPPVVGDARKARDFRRRGRQLLSALGAWPWAHAEGGRLPTGWGQSAEFLEPLWTWHAAARGELEAELTSTG